MFDLKPILTSNNVIYLKKEEEEEERDVNNFELINIECRSKNKFEFLTSDKP